MQNEHVSDEQPAPLPADAEALTVVTEALEPKRKKPALVQAGTRWVTSDGRFHVELATQYLLDHGARRWVTVSDLSKVFGGGNTNAGKHKVRKNMSLVFGCVLTQGHFLVYETTSRGRIESVKLLDAKSEYEMAAARPQLERMKRRHQITTDKYEKALSVIELRERL